MFAILYYAAMLIAYLLASPVLVCLCAFKQKYRHSIPARFAPTLAFARFWRNDMREFAPQVWIHACSLGEVNSLGAILDDSRLQNTRILLTTITNTGFARAQELFGARERVRVAFLPFEIFIPFLIPKSLKKLVVCEAELWFMLFFCAKKVGAKTLLLNARISTKSYPKYKKIAWFYARLFGYIDAVFCQQKCDLERLRELGAQNIKVIGNIKALSVPIVSKNLPKFRVDGENATLIIAASTHKGEEELILQSYADIANAKNRLIIAPRHPERFGEVWEILQKSSFKTARYSQSGLDYGAQVILLDTLGELVNVYNIADCVILGGSFVAVGGHNPIECAYFGAKIITGEFIFNQHALFALIEGYTTATRENLGAILKNLANLPHSHIKSRATMQDAIICAILGSQKRTKN